MPTLKATHIAKSLNPTRKPKLVKECVCPTAQGTDSQNGKKNNETLTNLQ